MTTKAAKSSAQRKREHDARKRAAGLKEFRAWVTPEERALLSKALAEYRQRLEQAQRLVPPKSGSSAG